MRDTSTTESIFVLNVALLPDVEGAQARACSQW